MKTFLAIVIVGLSGIITSVSMMSCQQPTSQRFEQDIVYSSTSSVIIEKVVSQKFPDGLILVKFEGKQYLIASVGQSVAIIEHIPN